LSDLLRLKLYSAVLVTFGTIAAIFAFIVPNPFVVEAFILTMLLAFAVLVLAILRIVLLVRSVRARNKGAAKD
jgi:uncharacterized membrane protein HdeD (DUF308 family)